jgi:hypothetical protein
MPLSLQQPQVSQVVLVGSIVGEANYTTRFRRPT